MPTRKCQRSKGCWDITVYSLQKLDFGCSVSMDMNNTFGNAYQCSAQPMPVHKRKNVTCIFHMLHGLTGAPETVLERPVHSVLVFQEKMSGGFMVEGVLRPVLNT